MFKNIKLRLNNHFLATKRDYGVKIDYLQNDKVMLELKKKY